MLSKGRIIVVDDESLVRMDFVEMLEEAGFEVVAQAADGIAAIEACKKHLPDVVLLDIEMPLLDGISAGKKISQDGLAGCVVFLTAYSSEKHLKKASEIGACGYLVKPLDEKSFIPTVKIAMSKGKTLMSLQKRIDKLETDLQNRKLIERAKGILMKKSSIDEEAAYSMMRTLSMQRRISMKELAEMIVLSDD
ncbi:response regulator receiver and ANTAR domain protein [Pilibacter termitis]|uniref:Response regulator receiver and ANTAR domain protein n=1 Tax=Pilibacter termitis TaxID=263852 RepID=A0A1T4K6M4_9ENTE|nr:response regulator receiver and ANTAR domain protein [Pilibacter termitis]